MTGSRRCGVGMAAKVIACLPLLASPCFFKYLVFLPANLNRVLPLIGSTGMTVSPILLPVGISFCAFQTLEGTEVVVRESAERDIRFGSEGWKRIPLPPDPRAEVPRRG